ncbi:site-2 protease family protein [Chamaesiphon polymorphus]|uniref:Zinc metalloprotease n=1 Tax=Chamaesiphon polymorphus CCALA 037 TaxID=2107692 RepID=A0A2T1GCT4_9CYAN|nr:site-2 protease family protein [Chamaesiphon polymorphus]PSB55128.1 site-2 protease family protein [Chamaesiphon polymorphus CCALA 037]
MNGNIRVGSLFGIPFYVNPSWFLVLGLVTWSYGEGLAAQFPDLPGSTPLLLGLVTALLLFGSVLAHELGHSFVAIKQGIKVDSITLFLFGGLASLEKESDSPANAFWVAIAGPAVSLVIAATLTGLGFATHITGPLAAIAAVLAAINLSLGLFNLIPGLPLDGGNILKAIVWKVTGNQYKGVKIASIVGQAFGWVAIASGLVPLFLYGSFDNFWNLLIGTFLLQNAGKSAQYARVQERLTGLTVADAVTPNSPIIRDNITLREFVDQRTLSGSNWQKFLVTNESGYLVGELALDALKDVRSDRWAHTLVSEIVQSIEPSTIIISDRPLLQAIEQLESKHVSTLSVTDSDGILVGLLEKTAVINLIHRQPQANPA